MKLLECEKWKLFFVCDIIGLFFFFFDKGLIKIFFMFFWEFFRG